MHIFNTLAPIFVLMGLGALLCRFRFLDDGAVNTLNRCCYWIGLPALLLHKIGFESAPAGAGGRTALALLAATGILLALAGGTGILLRQPARQLATFMHVVFRGNLAYVGLPVVIFAFARHPDGSAAGPIAATGLGVCVVVYNIAAVIMHLTAAHRLNATAMRRIAASMATNPLLLACLAGFAWQATGLPAPLFLDRSLVLAGQFALPLALLSVGCALVTTPLRFVALPAVIAAVLKNAAGPLAGLLAARLSGLPPLETGVVCILMATPTAIASYILTEQLHGDSRLAAGTIAASTLLSIPGLAVVLWLLDRYA